MTAEKKGMIAGTLGNVIFGFSYLFTGGALENIRSVLAGSGIGENADVPVLLCIRSLFALLLMTLMIPVFRLKLDLRGKPIRKLILLGVLQPVLYFIGETYGLKMTGIVVSSVMIALLPVFSQLFSVIILHEKTTLPQTLCALVSVGGVIAVTLFSSKGESKETYFVGVLLLLLAVFSAVSFNLLGRSIAPVFSPFERTYFMFAVSSVAFTAMALFSVRGNVSLLVAPLAVPSFLLQLLYLGGLSSVAAFFLTNYAKTQLPVTREAIFSNVITVVSTVTGFITEPEKSNIVLSAIICAVIVLGIWGVQKTAPRE